MQNKALIFLLDQNVPIAIAAWLKQEHPNWVIHHVNDLGFQGKPDSFLYKWAQDHSAIVITYDEDFADARMYPLGKHHGVIRLRVSDHDGKYQKSNFTNSLSGHTIKYTKQSYYH